MKNHIVKSLPVLIIVLMGLVYQVWAWHSTVYCNPNSPVVSDPLKAQTECGTWKNYSCCWWQLLYKYQRGSDDYKQIFECYWLTEKGCFEQIGSKAIQWTQENYPHNVDAMRKSVNDTLATFGSEPPPDPDPVCGNGVVEAGEQCDDGNIMSGDGCSSVCQTESTPEPEATGCDCTSLKTTLENIRDQATNALNSF